MDSNPFSCENTFNSCFGFGFIVKNPNKEEYYVKCIQYLSTLESADFKKCLKTLRTNHSFEDCADCRYNTCQTKSEAEDFMCHYSPNSELVIKKADSCKKLYCKYVVSYEDKDIYYIYNNPDIDDDYHLLEDIIKILNNSALGSMCLAIGGCV